MGVSVTGRRALVAHRRSVAIGEHGNRAIFQTRFRREWINGERVSLLELSQ